MPRLSSWPEVIVVFSSPAAFAVADALQRRQRLVSQGRLDAAVTAAPTGMPVRPGARGLCAPGRRPIRRW
ncbi:MAG: hypothetical protein ACYDHH_28970 [Solirubrobacteraceae bacterium]